MILTIIPIGLNWYELAVDALIFDLEYVWSSAGMGALYTLVVAVLEVLHEAVCMEDVALVAAQLCNLPVIYCLRVILNSELVNAYRTLSGELEVAGQHVPA